MFSAICEVEIYDEGIHHDYVGISNVDNLTEVMRLLEKEYGDSITSVKIDTLEGPFMFLNKEIAETLRKGI